MTRTTPHFHRFHCNKCNHTHYEHERSVRSFAGYVAKHISKCGDPQAKRAISTDYALEFIETRATGTHEPLQKA